MAALIILGAASLAAVENWPRFRGPNGCGVSIDGDFPTHFGPTSNVLWKAALPPGHSSPCIWDDRIFLTGFANGKLETLCLDRRDGKILWSRTALADKIEKTGGQGTPANSTPATDGERVYVYFGSFGLLSYDFAGSELWRVPLPPPVVQHGSGTSPIVAGELVVLACDQDMDSCLLALGDYYSSPVAAHGKICVASQAGVVTVLAAADSLTILAQNKMGEPVMATPAIVGQRLYLRTKSQLYAFGD